MKGIRGIIYDCDGVLFESSRANLAYYNAIFELLGESKVTAEDEESARLCHTAASPKVFEILLGADRVEEALAVAAGLDYRRFIPYMTPEPGMVEALNAFSGKFPLAVATNRGKSVMEVLSHFGVFRCFDTVVTARDVPNPKPHPDMLFLAAERLGLREQEVLFVGDSELDRQAAEEAGVRFVAYGGGVAGDVEISEHRELVRLMAEGLRA